MPSGAKKRKAARKKKESQPVSNHSNGDDGFTQQDDKDCDVGELSSPTSQDHNRNQDHMSVGDEEENEKGDNNSHTAAEVELKIKDIEESINVVKDDVPVDREFVIEDKSSETNDGSLSGSSSGSSSSSGSDDESHPIRKGEGAIDIAPVVDMGTGNVSLSGMSAENILGANNDGGVDSAVENFPAEELKNTSTLGDIVEADTSIVPSIIPMEFEEERLGFVEDNGITTVFMDVPSNREVKSLENIVIPDFKELVTQEIHDGVDTDIGVEVGKESGITEVLLVPAPHPAETTWKSCCGLFEVFARSDR